MKGNSGEGQMSFFGAFIEKYVEETAAYVIQPSISSFEDLSSLSALLNNHISHRMSNMNIIQDNSFLAYSSAVETLSSDFTDKDNEISTYIVQEGDTISFIASDFGVSVDTIIWANNLPNANALKPGVELKIPPVTGVLHTVAKGDTMSSIAKKYGVDQEEIVSFNDIAENSSLKIGAQIIVPGGKVIVPARTLAKSSYSSIQPFAYLPSLDGFFGLPTTLGFNWGRIHGRNGVDVANKCGTSIFAAADGTVTSAKSSGWNGGFGQFIKILHANGTETLYAHASKILVSTGASVSQGTEIALMGTTGRSTGCHVHFEVHGAKNPLAKK